MREKSKIKYTKAGMLAYFLKGSIFLFSVSIIANIIVTLLSTVIPQIISFTIDCVIGVDDVPDKYAFFVGLFGGIEYLKSNLWVLAVMIAAIAVLVSVFQFMRMYFNSRANQSLMCKMRESLFSHIQRLPLSWHQQHMTGDVIQRCTSDATTISDFISNQLVSLFRIAILFVFSLTFMFIMNVKLAAIAAAFIPVIVGYSVLFYIRAGKSFKKCDEEEGVLSTYAQENFTGVRVVRAFGKERYERDKFEKQNVYYTGLWVRIEKFLAMYWVSSDFLLTLQLMAIIIVGSLFCINGEITAGDLVGFIFYNALLMGPVRMLGRIISNLSKAGVSLGRIAEIMNADEEEYGSAEPLAGDIEFRDVSFEYEAGKPVLSGINLTVPYGSTLGIIGETGSGKSTLVALLERLYPLTNGEIYIGGRNINDVSPATLRKNVGLVLQEGFLFSRTVGENIGIAVDNPTEEEIKRAAEIACVDANIEGFAKGYDTMVGERGVTLSGGQKQRVSIARTMLRGTPYIIFDDSLSAVDGDTDARIRANLAQNCVGATVIIISHRISTVMHADNIIVMEGGRIAESGTHEQLLAADGIYKRVYDMQTSLPDELKEEAAND